jgi:hypothetical protein
MGLTMSEKRSVARETAVRYRRAQKAEKHKILDEFTHVTGYCRKYAIHILANWGKERILTTQGKTVRAVIGTPGKRKKRRGIPLYDQRIKGILRTIWGLFDYMCGKRLAVLIRLNIDLFQAQEDLGIDLLLREQLLRISPATIDRHLKKDRERLTLKGRSSTRAGALLKHQIPIRAFFDWDERKPGFFELDTVAHDGGRSSGEYCFTLTATDVYSGWVELRALPNRAHSWVKKEAESIRSNLPYPMKGIDSDNGGEFINHQLWNWCNDNHIQFTRGRAYRKNDNCFVEQKNDMAVRRTVGYYRFDTPAEYQALSEVYRHLCPLLNFYYPSVRIVEKTRVGARVKKVYDEPKPPYLRLLESPDVDDDVKALLRRRAADLHLIKQKRLVDQAVAKLMRLYEDKLQGVLSLGSRGETNGQG